MRAGYGWTELRSFRLVAANTRSFGLRPSRVILARRKIDIVMTGSAGRDARKLLPIFRLRAGVTGVAVSQVFGHAIAHNNLGITKVRIVGDLLIVTDKEEGLAGFHRWQQFAAMDLVDKDFELETFAGFRIDQL